MPKTREAVIDGWLHASWKLSTGGSGAIWKNLRGCHLAVWEDNKHPGEWAWRFTPVDSEKKEYSVCRYSSKEKAQRAVLEKLAGALGL